jgi:hypothetical protein
MPFGMHKGRSLAEIPTDYLRWLLRECHNLTPWLRSAVEAQLEFREYRGRRRASPSPDEPDEVPAHLPAVVQRWFREMALRFHPDGAGATRR